MNCLTHKVSHRKLSNTLYNDCVPTKQFGATNACIIQSRMILTIRGSPSTSGSFHCHSKCTASQPLTACTPSGLSLRQFGLGAQNGWMLSANDCVSMALDQLPGALPTVTSTGRPATLWEGKIFWGAACDRLDQAMDTLVVQGEEKCVFLLRKDF